MTKREAFEALLEKARDEEYLLSLYDVWQAACAWQREKDAEICENKSGSRWVPIEAANECVEAIRNQGVKNEPQ